jgi:serine/threonine protein kinase/ankyrin repeat protein
MSVQIIIKCSTPKLRQTRRFFVDPTTDVLELQETIKSQFVIPINEQIILFTSRGFDIRVISGFSLEFYGIGNNACLTLRRLEFDSGHAKSLQESLLDDEVVNENLDKRLETMNRLRIADRAANDMLQPIREVEETDEDDNHMGSLRKQFLDITKTKAVKEFDGFVALLMNLDFASQMLVVETTDKVGWAGIHYAVLYNEEYVIRELLRIFRQEILNILSSDGWSPMLLAVHNKHWNLFNVMVEFATTDQIYFESNKGCLLHLIFRFAEFEVIERMVLQKNIDPTKENFSGREALTLLSDRQQKKIVELMEMKRIPAKPANMFFKVGRWRFLFGWTVRLLFINAEKRALEIYEKPADYPFKPNEVIPLHGISDVVFLVVGKEATLANSNEFELNQFNSSMKPGDSSRPEKTFDMEFRYGDSSYSYRLICFEHLSIVGRTLKQAIEWSQYYDRFISKMKDQEIKEQALELWKQHSTKFETFDLYLKKEVRRWRAMHLEAQTSKSTANKPAAVSIADFDVIKLIGRGAFGKVYKVVHRKTKRILALKILSKNQLIREKQVKYCLIEKRILQGNNNHPFLISLHFAFQTTDALCMVLDFCPHGDFSDMLSKMPGECLPEPAAKFYMAELLLALEEMHKKHYIHRDLKPENILVDELGHLKLTDFGLAAENIRSKNQFTQSSCGSPVYMAAELLVKGNVKAYKSSDYYSFGVVLYQVLTGQLPFMADDLKELKSIVMKGKFDFPSNITLSAEAKDLLSGLLRPNHKTRLGAKNGIDEIKSHAFFREVDWNALASCSISPPIIFFPPIQNLSKKITLKMADYQEGGSRANYLPNFDFVRNDYL